MNQAMLGAPLMMCLPVSGVRHPVVEEHAGGDSDLNGHKQEMVLSNKDTETNLIVSFTERTVPSPGQRTVQTVKTRMATRRRTNTEAPAEREEAQGRTVSTNLGVPECVTRSGGV